MRATIGLGVLLASGIASADPSAKQAAPPVVEEVDPDSGVTHVRADLGSARHKNTTYSASLGLSAAKKSGPIKLSLFERLSRGRCKSMSVRASGKRVKLKGKPTISTAHVTLASPEGSYGGISRNATVLIRRSSVRRLVRAKTVEIKACGIKATLTKDQLVTLRAFAIAIGVIKAPAK